MLSTILKLLESTQGALSLNEISRQLDVQPAALQGMLDLLVRRGKLLEIGPDGGVCSTCGLESECNLLAVRGKRYVVGSRRSSPIVD